MISIGWGEPDADKTIEHEAKPRAFEQGQGLRSWQQA